MILLRKIFLSAVLFLFMFCVASIYSSAEDDYGQAIFAGGCFWCMESDFEMIPGIKKVISGYIGGTKKNPSYRNYSKSGHIEAVHISYEPSVISYAELLEIFWIKIDPTDNNGQFCDRGHEYSTAIFYFSPEQKRLAEESKNQLEKSDILNESVKTPIIMASEFYPAEDYHQNYYKKSSIKYHYYRFRCGRDQRLKELWGEKINEDKTFNKTSYYQKPSLEELKKILTPLQFKVTQKNGTEQPFRNEYWNNKKEGIYVDIVSGEPLFSSTNKYKSGTGWPSFTRPIEGAGIILKEDRNWFSVRTELRSKQADSHLGHLFSDGPKPDGLRYCINSAALRFVSKNDLEKDGYHSYLNLFQ